MKKYLTTFSLLVSLVSSAAQAQESLSNLVLNSSEEVLTSSVKILGKGLMNQETNESIAYACVGASPDTSEPTCNMIRMIYLNPQSNKSYFFGNPMLLQVVNKKDLRSMFRKIRKTYNRENPTKISQFCKGMHDGMNDAAKTVGKGTRDLFKNSPFVPLLIPLAGMVIVPIQAPALGMAGIWGLTAAAPALENLAIGFAVGAGAEIGLVVGVFAAGAVVYLAAEGLGSIRISPLSSSTFQSFQNTNGWNWSSNPKKLSAKKFEKYLQYFNSMKLVQN